MKQLDIFVYTSLFFLLCVLYANIYYRLASQSTRQMQVVENLSTIYELPQTGIPELQGNIVTDDAFTLLDSSISTYRIVYAHSSRHTNKSLVLFANKLFFEKSGKQMHVYCDTLASYKLCRVVFDLIPTFTSLYNGSLTIHTPSELNDHEHLQSGERAAYAILISHNSNLVNVAPKVLVLRQYNIAVFDYYRYIDDPFKIAFALPYCKINSFQMSHIFPEKTEIDSIYRCIAFERLVCTKKDIDEPKVVEQLQVSYANKSPDALTDMYAKNFYEMMGFKIYPTLHLTNTLTYVEAFSSSQSPVYNNLNENVMITVSPKNNVSLELLDFSNTHFKQFKISSRYVQGVKMKINDTIYLHNQNHDFENGNYRVVDVRESAITIANGFRMDWIPSVCSVTSIDDLNHQWLVKVLRDHPLYIKFHATLKVGDLIFINDPIKMPGYIIQFEPDYIMLNVIDHEWTVQKHYECYGDSSNYIKEACEEKSFRWDRRCTSHAECPFFEKNDASYRGGCSNGYCEMPLNVKRTSYRTYELSDSSYPFCKGCKESLSKEDMLACCKSRNKNTKTGDVYAFPGGSYV